MSYFLNSEDVDKLSPHVFIQWKGTDVCLDFTCSCGEYFHFDGFFGYAYKCPYCELIWEMPCLLVPRIVDKFDGIVQEPLREFN